nr:hypothetical protein HmN_000958600 [Hymenolepis microstoma]CUU98225.1 hypothetical transcript [Hymenolepis microstoma]
MSPSGLASFGLWMLKSIHWFTYKLEPSLASTKTRRDVKKSHVKSILAQWRVGGEPALQIEFEIVNFILERVNSHKWNSLSDPLERLVNGFKDYE